MKQVYKLGVLFAIASAIWVALLQQQSSFLPKDTILVLPLYAVVGLGCYGLAMVGYGLMVFPNCPEQAVSLQQDVMEAKFFLQNNGIYLHLENTNS